MSSQPMITSGGSAGNPSGKALPHALLQDPVLRSAYERLDQYDRAALRYKRQHVNLRALVLLLAFVASLLAVIASAGGQFFWVSVWIQQAFHLDLNASGIDQTLTLVLFLIPLIGSGLLAYATQPLPNSSWVNYRFSAEMIRRAIYCYIMQAGDFYDKPLTERRGLLVNAVQQADSYSNENVDLVQPFLEFDDARLAKQLNMTLFVKNAPYKQTIQAQLRRLPGNVTKLTLFQLRKRTERTWLGGMFGKNVAPKSPDLRDPTFEDYVANRFYVQLEWYTFKASTDFSEARRLQRRGLIIGGAGSLLSFLGFAPWIAVTTAAATTTSGLAALLMYGRTYTAYLVAAQKLRANRDWWAIMTAEQQADPAARARFIAQSEGCFREEMESWAQLAAQNLTELDKTLRDRQDLQGSAAGAVVTVQHEETVMSTDTVAVQTAVNGNGNNATADKLADVVVGQVQALAANPDATSHEAESEADDTQSVALNSGDAQDTEPEVVSNGTSATAVH